MAFDRSFLRRMTDAKPSELAIIRVKGHSMEPTLMDDDHVLVDRSKTSLSYDGLFVLRFDDVLHVKRIGRSAIRGQVVVISDHPAYRDLDMPKVDLDVIGRVLWVGRKV
jgi:phage repressor protein C with HTH and peptisase S24 domain